MAYVSPIEQKSLATPAPLSAKKQFERLIRDIRSIVANSRTFTGEVTADFVEQFETSSKTQKKYTNIGSMLQISVPVVSALLAINKGQEVAGWLDMGKRAGDIANSLCGGARFDHEVNTQRIQQAQQQMGGYDQRIQSFMQSIETALQLLRQQEMDQARFS